MMSEEVYYSYLIMLSKYSPNIAKITKPTPIFARGTLQYYMHDVEKVSRLAKWLCKWRLND